ncbi:hypothetical protein [Paenibacillus agilis]|uniref:Uncharacterized protein n=1 Tax=Paenibacillus agilis TaxID=3020863 RepID=A0A559IE78_9BACL|nr:hypothetical protein [Paenibacillus agilis]TVX85968.1 hypothetical protein FPZ44_23740 [Paenibacillus agilis]
MSQMPKKVPYEEHIEQTRAKHTKSPYLGDYTPEEVLKHKIDLMKMCIRQYSETLEEYRLFTEQYMATENYFVSVVLTIAHEEYVKADEIEKFNSNLEELYEDAKIMGVEVEK